MKWLGENKIPSQKTPHETNNEQHPQNHFHSMHPWKSYFSLFHIFINILIGRTWNGNLHHQQTQRWKHRWHILHGGTLAALIKYCRTVLGSLMTDLGKATRAEANFLIARWEEKNQEKVTASVSWSPLNSSNTLQHNTWTIMHTFLTKLRRNRRFGNFLGIGFVRLL